MQPKPEFLNPDDFPEPHMEPVKMSEAERLAHWLEFLHDDNTLETHAAAELRRLAAEVERANEARRQAQTQREADYTRLMAEAKREQRERGRLAAEVEALRADAERYRWLRRDITTLADIKRMNDIVTNLCLEDMDAAIDAAKASVA